MRTGVTHEDEDVALLLQKSGKPVLVAANKVDDNSFVPFIYEFYNLGFSEIFPVSSLHGIGIGDLLAMVIALLPEEKSEDPVPVRFCLIGQQNVGKSTLANTIIGEERVYRERRSGNDQDAIDTLFTRDGKNR